MRLDELDEQVVERRLAHADADDILGALSIDPVDIDVGQRAIQGIQRVRRVVLGAEQSLFLGGHNQE